MGIAILFENTPIIGDDEYSCESVQKTLSDLELKVLNYGLNFVMTPLYNSFQTHIDVYKLVRQLKLRYLFFFGNSDVQVKKFHPKSTFVPSVQNEYISVFEKLVLRDISHLENKC